MSTEEEQKLGENDPTIHKFIPNKEIILKEIHVQLTEDGEAEVIGATNLPVNLDERDVTPVQEIEEPKYELIPTNEVLECEVKARDQEESSYHFTEKQIGVFKKILRPMQRLRDFGLDSIEIDKFREIMDIQIKVWQGYGGNLEVDKKALKMAKREFHDGCSSWTRRLFTYQDRKIAAGFLGGLAAITMGIYALSNIVSSAPINLEAVAIETYEQQFGAIPDGGILPEKLMLPKIVLAHGSSDLMSDLRGEPPRDTDPNGYHELNLRLIGGALKKAGIGDDEMDVFIHNPTGKLIKDTEAYRRVAHAYRENKDMLEFLRLGIELDVDGYTHLPGSNAKVISTLENLAGRAFVVFSGMNGNNFAMGDGILNPKEIGRAVPQLEDLLIFMAIGANSSSYLSPMDIPNSLVIGSDLSRTGTNITNTSKFIEELILSSTKNPEKTILDSLNEILKENTAFYASYVDATGKNYPLSSSNLRDRPGMIPNPISPYFLSDGFEIKRNIGEGGENIKVIGNGIIFGYSSLSNPDTVRILKDSTGTPYRLSAMERSVPDFFAGK